MISKRVSACPLQWITPLSNFYRLNGVCHPGGCYKDYYPGAQSLQLITRRPGPPPTNDISIEFEIQLNFVMLLFITYSADQ